MPGEFSFKKSPCCYLPETAKVLLAQFPTAPNYPQADGSVKLAAGWLIDQCQLKGMQMGGAAVHRQQALVLINEDNAKSEDVVQLALHVRQKVGENLMSGLSLKFALLVHQVKLAQWRRFHEG